jgi:hypothetical protein
VDGEPPASNSPAIHECPSSTGESELLGNAQFPKLLIWKVRCLKWFRNGVYKTSLFQ